MTTTQRICRITQKYTQELVAVGVDANLLEELESQALQDALSIEDQIQAISRKLTENSTKSKLAEELIYETVEKMDGAPEGGLFHDLDGFSEASINREELVYAILFIQRQQNEMFRELKMVQELKSQEEPKEQKGIISFAVYDSQERSKGKKSMKSQEAILKAEAEREVLQASIDKVKTQLITRKPRDQHQSPNQQPLPSAMARFTSETSGSSVSSRENMKAQEKESIKTQEEATRVAKLRDQVESKRLELAEIQRKKSIEPLEIVHKHIRQLQYELQEKQHTLSDIQSKENELQELKKQQEALLNHTQEQLSSAQNTLALQQMLDEEEKKTEQLRRLLDLCRSSDCKRVQQAVLSRLFMAEEAQAIEQDLRNKSLAWKQMMKSTPSGQASELQLEVDRLYAVNERLKQSVSSLQELSERKVLEHCLFGELLENKFLKVAQCLESTRISPRAKAEFIGIIRTTSQMREDHSASLSRTSSDAFYKEQ
eukprot:TRINITY_DN8678_c0_g1_i1.p1 TRINITY_DN8678_c0_g1~~TRINITY_DN8678_c0_g1_i1.p1  ORF type:complete len:486 (+),score=125.89 TRINITY_DN8678_c0_g1_i1:76-1533(+)